jgi:hypothetical protein
VGKKNPKTIMARGPNSRHQVTIGCERQLGIMLVIFKSKIDGLRLSHLALSQVNPVSNRMTNACDMPGQRDYHSYRWFSGFGQ